MESQEIITTTECLDCNSKAVYLLSLIMALSLLANIPVLATENTDQKTVRWLVFDQAPYWFSSPPLKGQGMGRKLVEIYKAALPDYNHQIITTNVSRYTREIQKPNTCVPFAWLTHYEEHLLHTRPVSIEPPMGIFVNDDKKHLIPHSDGWVDLIDLLESSQLRFGYIHLFDYGTKLNEYIENNQDKKNLIKFVASTAEINLKLLRYDRLDLIIAMPVQSRREALLGQEDNYSFFQISEISNYIRIYSHCSNDETGRAVLTVMNSILTDDFLTSHAEGYYNWYSANPSYKKLYEDVVIKQLPKDNVDSRFQ